MSTEGAWGSGSGPGNDGLEGVSQHSLQCAGGSTSPVGSSVVALLTLVGDGITARWLLAVRSASVGLPIRVEEHSEIALFTSFLDSVSADWGREDARSGDSSVVEGLNWSGLVADAILGVGEGGILSVGHGLDLGEDEPLDTFGTWWHGLRTSVGE